MLASMIASCTRWRPELRCSVDGPGVPHGQCLCGSVCIVESSAGIRCNRAVYGKGPSSLITCLDFTQLGPSLSLNSEGRVCKHPSSSHALLRPILWIALGTRLSRQDDGGKTIQNEGEEQKKVAWCSQATAHVLCCKFPFQYVDWAFWSHYQNLICSDEQWFNRIVNGGDFPPPLLILQI